MAILISARGVCQSRMTRGEKWRSDRVHAPHFQRWGPRQPATDGRALPSFYDGRVAHAIHTAERCHIPTSQYLAVLIDDAQSIYERRTSRDGSKQFSFKSVGIQAQGRTTILKINYRNTRQILHTASLVAAKHWSPHAPPLRGSLPRTGTDPAWGGPAPDRLLTADDKDDGAGSGAAVPLFKPVSCGREGQAPVIIKLPTLRDEAFAIADQPGQRPQRRLCLGRRGRAVLRLENHGPVRRGTGPTQAAAPRAQEEW